MNIENKIAFIGPLPPPLGGVAVMNKSIQELLVNELKITSFNTSSGKDKEDLYSKNYFKKVLPQIKKLFQFIQFAKNDDYKIVNLFVTSGVGFVREALYILTLRLFRKKIIVHLHSKKKGEFFLYPYRIRVFSYFLNMCHKILVLSNDHESYFQKYLRNEKLEILENFVDYSLYGNDANNKQDDFLYVGRLSKMKGFYDLLKMVRYLKQNNINYKFKIVGVADNNTNQEKIQTLIDEYGIKDMVVLHGPVFGQEKYDLFKKCKFFIFPSHFENSPVVLKEAIASKMHIFSSDIEANRVVLKPIHNVTYFKKENYIDMAKKIMNHDELEHQDNIFYGYDKSIAKQILIDVIEKLSKDSI